MVTDSVLCADSGRSSSTVQFWSFDAPLNTNTVQPPKLIISKKCPFGVLSTCQVTSLDGRSYCGISCSDGLVRLIRLGIEKNKFAIDIDSCRILTIGYIFISLKNGLEIKLFRRNVSCRSGVCAIDSFSDKVLVGYSSGNCAIFSISEEGTGPIYPLQTFPAHSRPITTLKFHPIDVRL